MITLTCQHCGNGFQRIKNGKRSLEQKYCSRTCRGAAATAARGGPEKLMITFREINPDTGCWEWTGELTKTGYGRMVIKRKRYPVHRMSAAIHLGLDIQNSAVFVLHRCDNPRCFNPAHLFLGDAADNRADMVSKGRQKNARGDELPQAILTAEKVMEMRKRHANGASYDELAADTGVSRYTIKDAVKGVTWAHLPMVPTAANRRAVLRSDNTAGFKGVRTLKTGRFAAYVWRDGKQHHLGVYATAEQAARAHDAVALELFGKDARLNFT